MSIKLNHKTYRVSNNTRKPTIVTRTGYTIYLKNFQRVSAVGQIGQRQEPEVDELSTAGDRGEYYYAPNNSRRIAM